MVMLPPPLAAAAPSFNNDEQPSFPVPKCGLDSPTLAVAIFYSCMHVDLFFVVAVPPASFSGRCECLFDSEHLNQLWVLTLVEL